MTSPAEGAPELYVVVADADVLWFIDGVLRRGVERKCLRPLRWVLRRDPMRDAGVRQSPLRAVPDVSPGCAKLLVVLDHHGCGGEAEPPEAVEAQIQGELERAGFSAEGARCVVLAPELEAALVPVWDRVAELMAAKRQRPAPTPAAVMVALSRSRPAVECEVALWSSSLERHPKECFLGLLRLLNLRHQPALYEEIAREVSLPALKEGEAANRLAGQLTRWFGAEGMQSCGDSRG